MLKSPLFYLVKIVKKITANLIINEKMKHTK